MAKYWIAGIFASALCCAGQAFCSNACTCCKSLCGISWKQQIRLCYIILNLLCTLFVIFTFYYLQDIFEKFSDYVDCPSESGGGSDCLGSSSVYRMSFTLATFYIGIFILLLLCCGSQMKKSINEGLWCFKVTYIIGIFILIFFVPNSFFKGYSYFAKYTSILYLLFQSLVIIDLLYMWSQKWVKQYNDGNQSMKYILIFTAFILYGLAMALNIMSYIWFKGCSYNIAINSINILIIVIITFVQILGYNPYGSLIASGGLSLYISFLTFSAQFSSPDADCNELISDTNDKNGFYFDLSIAIFLSFIVMVYITFNNKKSTSKTTQDHVVNINQVALPDDKEDEEDLKEEQQKINDKETQENASAQAVNQKSQPSQAQLKEEHEKEERRVGSIKEFRMFHIVMFFISVYTCMLITNWGTPDFNENTFNLYQPSASSYWIKISIAWISSVIYLWTLIAPKIFENRDFS